MSVSLKEKVNKHGGLTIDCINNRQSIRDITYWFVDCCRYLVFLEPEATIFGREASSPTIPDDREYY